MTTRLVKHLAWFAVAVLGACALSVVALRRGEPINALWIVVAAVAIYLVAYRYYSLFIANNVMQLDARRQSPRSGGRRGCACWSGHSPGHRC